MTEAQSSTVDDALGFIDELEAQHDSHVAWKLDPDRVYYRLRELVSAPSKLHQRGLNACGPAVFLRIWFARDPLAAAVFTADLLGRGQSVIGDLPVTPGAYLLEKQYAYIKAAHEASQMPEQCDRMLLSALRDSENILPYPAEPETIKDAISGMTLPGTVIKWLQATKHYSSFIDGTNLASQGDRQVLLDLLPAADEEHILLTNVSAVSPLFPAAHGVPPEPGIIASFFPNHYVLANGRVALADEPGWVNLNFWTWGEQKRGCQGTEMFFRNYYGVIIATV